MRFRKSRNKEEADLDITSFMNLMIILVPVLLPELASDSSDGESEENLILEVLVRPSYLDINYPAGTLLKRLPMVASDEESENLFNGQSEQFSSQESRLMVHDFELLSLVLQEVKRQLALKGIDKNDILLLSEPDTSYQTLISTMDAIRSYKAVVVTEVVDAALFPDISLGDAPELPVIEGEQPVLNEQSSINKSSLNRGGLKKSSLDTGNRSLDTVALSLSAGVI